MSYRRVVPCLDVRDGRVVKGVKFQNLRDAGDPVEAALRYEEEGADELVLLDVSATPEGKSHAVETVAKVRAGLGIPLLVGGGIRELYNAGQLLEAGADKVALNSAAFDRPELIAEIASRFGVQCTVIAIDAAREGEGWVPTRNGGRVRLERDAIAWAREAVALGAGEILLTSWDRDGTRAGYDLELLQAVTESVNVPVIASGGAATIGHLQEAVAAGADAVLAASIFHDGEFSVADVKRGLIDLSVEVRPC